MDGTIEAETASRITLLGRFGDSTSQKGNENSCDVCLTRRGDGCKVCNGEGLSRKSFYIRENRRQSLARIVRVTG